MDNNKTQSELDNTQNINSQENDQLVEDTVREICRILTSTDENFAFDFLECLFTPAERKDMANRWLLVKELDKGTTQREIAKKFGMSLCKITRGSRELHKQDSAFRRMLNILEETQNKSK